jgi:uncharacterized protein YjbI with pentapeptide repeats
MKILENLEHMDIRANDKQIHGEGKTLLQEMKIQDYNRWRMENLTIRPDFSGEIFSGLDLSGAYLNGVKLNKTNLSHCNLAKTNLVQADLVGADLEGADLSNALLMYWT